jgi:hypothetical protein
MLKVAYDRNYYQFTIYFNEYPKFYIPEKCETVSKQKPLVLKTQQL